MRVCEGQGAVELVLFFHLYVGSADWTQVTRLAQAPLLIEPQSHFDVVYYALLNLKQTQLKNWFLCVLT